MSVYQDRSSAGTPARLHAMATDSAIDPDAGSRRDQRRDDPVGEGYEARGLIGRGGMGRVDLVQHLRWDQLVAVKRPHGGLWDRAATERLLDEARVWMELPPHPHLCTCHYVTLVDGEPWIVMEYVRGGSLADSSPADPEALLDTAIQVAWGLSAAHAAGVAHRDVKPANVLLDAAGAKVTDFGLAAALGRPGAATGDAPDDAVTHAGLTPAFASPEQAAGRRTGRASDVWSFAVTVLALHRGLVDWVSGADHARLLAHLSGAGPHRMPAAVAEVLRGCLVVDARARPTMETVAARLRHAYRATFGRPHPRPVPGGREHLADGLNNRALSWIELGDRTRAERYWEQALLIDPHHPEAVYNSNLARWRAGACTDDTVVGALEPLTRRGAPEVRERTAALLAAVHLERGDIAAASARVTPAARRGPSPVEEYGRALELAAWTNPVTAVSVAADGENFCGHWDGTVRWMPPGTGGIGHQRHGHGGRVTAVVGVPGGRVVASAGLDHTVRLWRRRSRYGRVLAGHAHEVVALAPTPDGTQLLSVDAGGELRRWGVRTGRHLAAVVLRPGVVAAAFTADAEQVVLATEDGAVGCWEARTGHGRWTVAGHDGGALAVAVAGDHVASAGTDRTVRVWAAADGGALAAFDGHTGRVGAVALLGDDLWSHDDDTLRLWDLAERRCRRTWSVADRRVTAMAVVPDRRLVCGHRDGTVRWGWLPSPWSGVVAAAGYSRPRTADEVAEDVDTLRHRIAAARALVEKGDVRGAKTALTTARVVRYDVRPEP